MRSLTMIHQLTSTLKGSTTRSTTAATLIAASASHSATVEVFWWAASSVARRRPTSMVISKSGRCGRKATRTLLTSYFADRIHTASIALPTLLTLPARLALVEEGVHSLAEILAHIRLQQQILAFVAGQRAADAAHRFLGHFEGERGMAGDQLRGLGGAALQRLDVRHHLVEHSQRQRLGRLEQPGGEDQILGARRADQ